MNLERLKHYRAIEDQINYLVWSVNRSKRELKRLESYDFVNCETLAKSRLIALKKDIAKKRNEIEKFKKINKEVHHLIDSFSEVDRLIIRLKYIDGNEFEAIADVTGYSISYIKKRHTEIKKTLKCLDAKEK